MVKRARWGPWMLTTSCLLGCAKGSDADFEFDSGIYELATVAVEGDCSLEDAITEGGEYVGKLFDVQVTVSDTSVRLEVCDPFFDDCFSTLTELSLIRDGDNLYASDPHWEIPGCSCWEAYTGTREVDGGIIADGQARLDWSFVVPAPPPDCTCTAWTACQGTARQLLTQP